VRAPRRPKRKVLYGKTRAEVAEKLTREMADRDGELIFEANSLTVGEYLDRRLADGVRDTVRRSTYIRYGPPGRLVTGRLRGTILPRTRVETRTNLPPNTRWPIVKASCLPYSLPSAHESAQVGTG
jgi:hypothetical protein